MALANVHNCSFFECFERRFPCKRHHGLSHVLDFELTSCREFYKEFDTFDKQVRFEVIHSVDVLVCLSCRAKETEHSEKRQTGKNKSDQG